MLSSLLTSQKREENISQVQKKEEDFDLFIDKKKQPEGKSNNTDSEFPKIAGRYTKILADQKKKSHSTSKKTITKQGKGAQLIQDDINMAIKSKSSNKNTKSQQQQQQQGNKGIHNQIQQQNSNKQQQQKAVQQLSEDDKQIQQLKRKLQDIENNLLKELNSQYASEGMIVDVGKIRKEYEIRRKKETQEIENQIKKIEQKKLQKIEQTKKKVQQQQQQYQQEDNTPPKEKRVMPQPQRVQEKVRVENNNSNHKVNERHQQNDKKYNNTKDVKPQQKKQPLSTPKNVADILKDDKYERLGKRKGERRYQRSRYSDEEDDDDSLDGFIDHGEDNPLQTPEYRNLINGLFRKKHNNYYDDYDEGSSDMEAGFEEIEYEERRSRRIGKQEDEEEYKRIIHEEKKKKKIRR